MKKIPIGQDLFALVGDEDFEELSNYRWGIHQKENGSLYVRRYLRIGPGKYKRVYMHTHLMNTPKGMEVDHRNGNGLDNQRSNLRVTTHKNNCRNSRISIDARKTSLYKGVGLSPGTNPSPTAKNWRARIRVNGVLVQLGFFSTQEEAAIAYNFAAIEHFGEFARLNPIASAECIK